MEAVLIPAKTVVHIGGIPVSLAVDTLVETAYGNMALLTGYHYAHLPEAPEAVPSPPEGRPTKEEQEKDLSRTGDDGQHHG